ncbi:MAG: nuclease-related domain-containing protein, partial [Thermomicrobiales bacterium]
MAEVIDAAVGYRNPGEERALAVLRTLPDDWLVIANKNLPLRHGRSVEIDFIVIGPHRVVLLDEKAYRGTFTGSDQAWRLNDGAARPSPLNKIDFTAKEIAGWVRTNVPAFPGIERGTPPLIGGILLSPPTANAQITDPRAIRHPLRLENARDKLLWLDREGADAGLDIGALRPKLKLALHNVDAARRPKRPRSIDLYVIEDQLGERPGCRVFAGRHENGVQRTLYVYENDAADPARRQALDHELTALKNLQETGAAPKIGESFLWSEGEFRVVPVDLPAGAAVGALPAVADEGGAVREVERAAAAFHALARVHQAGVVHRAINP